jgi:hypothetical protein
MIKNRVLRGIFKVNREGVTEAEENGIIRRFVICFVHQVL